MFAGSGNTNCVYFVRTMTSPERKLGITDGRVSQATPDPVLAHRARRDAHSELAICITHHFCQQGGGFDRNLWTPQHIFSAIEYIHMNPVRDGLCARAEEWKWSSASQYASLRDKVPVVQTMLPIDIDHLPADPR